jgi:ketosteroid isomerase-like protein
MQRVMESSFRPSGQEGRERAPGLLDRIQKALADKDLDALAALYAEDATLEEVSSMNPPSHPKVAQGREAILVRLRRLASATLIDGIETEDALAFTELRTYAAGDKAMAQHFAHKRGGRIARDRLVIAWDAD